MIFWIPSFFSKNPVGGGELRTAQIGEYIAKLHKGEKIVRLSYELNKEEILLQIVRRFILSLQLPSKRLGNLRQFAENFKAFEEIRNWPNIEEDSIIYWESTKDFSFAKWLKRLPFKVIVLPHNIESKVIYEKSNPVDLFLKEIKALSYCDKVFTISQKDSEILQDANLVAETLTFKLCHSAMQNAQSIAEERKLVGKIDFLMMGSATDPATYVGTQKLLEILDDVAFQSEHFKLMGKGTECFENKAPKNCEILGWQSPSELDKHLISTRAVIIYHPPSSGYLTRIEFLKQASVPIFINREYADYKNLDAYCSVYNSASELAALLQKHS